MSNRMRGTTSYRRRAKHRRAAGRPKWTAPPWKAG